MANARHAVMVVEDDEAIRLSMQMFFEEEGYTVITAENGQAALDQLKGASDQVCMIFLDLFMPIMDGARFLEKINQDGTHPAANIPIVVVSAAPPDGPMAYQVKSQAKHFVQKPACLDLLFELSLKYCSNC